MNHAGTPTNKYGMQETPPPAFHTLVVPEALPEVEPKPERWQPGPPNYPWLRIGGPKPPPSGERLCELYLLAWIQEITRSNAELWLSLNQDYEQKVIECNRLQKAIAAQSYQNARAAG